MNHCIRYKKWKATVQFENETKAFILDEKYTSRPRFEDDGEIVSAVTEYARAKERIDRIHKEITSYHRKKQENPANMFTRGVGDV